VKFNRENKPSKTPVVVFGSISVALALLLFYAVATDSSGAPETGWQALLAFIFIGPLLLGSSLITLFLFINFKLADRRTYSGPTIDSIKSPDKNDPPITTG
jgi:hypothetical protein